MREIELTQGFVAFVDDEDFDWLSQWKWHVWIDERHDSPYAIRNTYNAGVEGTAKMHRVIMGDPVGLVDHVNREGLDNQRHNLRVVTVSQNAHNRKRNSNNTSGYKGVGWRKDLGKWTAIIGVDGRRLFLGFFTHREEAARAYDAAAVEHVGEHATLNFPVGSDDPANETAAQEWAVELATT